MRDIISEGSQKPFPFFFSVNISLHPYTVTYLYSHIEDRLKLFCLLNPPNPQNFPCCPSNSNHNDSHFFCTTCNFHILHIHYQESLSNFYHNDLRIRIQLDKSDECDVIFSSFSRVHATLRTALSVCLSVCWSVHHA